MLIHHLLSVVAPWWTDLTYHFYIHRWGIWKVYSAWVKASRCWWERYLMHVICTSLEPVWVCSWAFLSSLICVSLTMQYSCSPPPNTSCLASSLPPQLPPSISVSHSVNMNTHTHSDSAKECRRGRTALPTGLTRSPSQTENRSPELDSVNSTLNKYRDDCCRDVLMTCRVLKLF